MSASLSLSAPEVKFKNSTYSFGDSQVLISGAMSGKPDRIFCRDCHTSSIPAPDGATSQTQYVCQECSPLGPEDTHFDRFQFDRAASAHVEPLSKQQLLHMVTTEMSTVLRRAPAPVIRARDNGEKWAVNATARNIAKLSPRRRQALLLTHWCDLSSDEAAEIMGVEAQTVRVLSLQARRILDDLNAYSEKISAYEEGRKRNLIRASSGNATRVSTPRTIADDSFQATDKRQQDTEPEIYTSADLQATQGKPL